MYSTDYQYHPSYKDLYSHSWFSLLPALYGALFTGDDTAPGFSNYRLWESLGFVLAYVFQTYLCVDVKLWILVGFLTAGMAGYLVVEVGERGKRD